MTGTDRVPRHGRGRASHHLRMLTTFIVAPIFLVGCPGEDAAPGDPPLDTVPESSPPDTATATVDTPIPPPTEPPPDVRGREPAHQEEIRDTLRIAEGVIGVTGTAAEPIALLRREEAPSLGLTGVYSGELRRLSGARVRVEGGEASTPVGPGIRVTDYRILEIDGRVPHVGILERIGEEGWRLVPAKGEPLVLEGLPTERLEEGMKIWVVGKEADPDRLLVESHGVVAPPRRDPG